MKKGTALKRKRGDPKAPLSVSLCSVGTWRRDPPADLTALPSHRAAPGGHQPISPPPMRALVPFQAASMPKCIGGGWSLLVQEVQSVGKVGAVAWQRDSRHVLLVVRPLLPICKLAPHEPASRPCFLTLERHPGRAGDSP